MDMLNTIGKRVRLLRGDLDLTQEELIRQLEKHGVEVGQTHISNIERKDTLPSGKVLAGLARVLRTTTDYLLLLTDDPLIPEDKEDTEEEPFTADELALIRNLRRLAPPDQRSVIDLAGRLADFALRIEERAGRGLPDQARPPIPRLPQSRDDYRSLLAALPEDVMSEVISATVGILNAHQRRA